MAGDQLSGHDSSERKSAPVESSEPRERLGSVLRPRNFVDYPHLGDGDRGKAHATHDRQRDHGGKFRVAQCRKRAAQSGEHEGKHQARPGIVRTQSRKHKYARTDDRPEEEAALLSRALEQEEDRELVGSK